MKHSSPFIMIVALFAAGCAPQGEDPDRMIAEANALDRKFFEIYNAADLDGMMELYWNSPDVVSYSPGQMEMKGWDEVKEGFRRDFAMSTRGRLELVESHNMVAGDVVIGWGRWRYTTTDPPMEQVGRYTDVKARRNGKWVYIHDHASVPLPPPPGN